ncbi:MAG: hypothetical protein IJG31_02240 [Fusobacterium sp.]|nr:hypothetical protein [Fusobacterium sp.]
MFTILILTILLNLTFFKFQNFKETQSIIEAKMKITEAFSYASISSLSKHQNKIIQFHVSEKKIIISNHKFTKEKEIFLPRNLIYYSTINQGQPYFNINFTKNGNISQSFSIYIFGRKRYARYKISFYGFDRSKFLIINNYKNKEKNKIYLHSILKYHTETNEDRAEFYSDWKKE